MSLDDALKRAYEMGKDCGLNSPNTTNCNFALFATLEMTKEWERGKREGDALRAHLDEERKRES